MKKKSKNQCFNVTIPGIRGGTQLALDIQSGFKPLEGPVARGTNGAGWGRGIYILQIKLYIYIYARGVQPF